MSRTCPSKISKTGAPERTKDSARAVRICFAAAFLALGGCAAPADTQTAPAMRSPVAAVQRPCAAAQLQALKGRRLDSGLRAELQRDGAVVRVIRHGEPATLEYSESRLTVRLDPLGRITAIECG